MLPTMSIQLRARREARGLTQEEFAELLGIDNDTISRWERGLNKPKGVSAIAALKSRLGISQTELDQWFVEWAMRELKIDDNYSIRGYEFLEAKKLPIDEFLETLIEIDTSIVPRVTVADEGTVDQWVPIFHESPFTWKILTFGDKIVGYWHYVCMKEEFFEQVKVGAIRDSEITVDKIEVPTFFSPSRTFKMYITMIGVHATHMHLGPGRMLMSSFLKEFSRVTKNGLYFSEIAAVAFTPIGLSLCREFSMSHIGHHPAAAQSEIAEIFHIDAIKLSRAGFLSRNASIAQAYRARFG